MAESPERAEGSPRRSPALWVGAGVAVTAAVLLLIFFGIGGGGTGTGPEPAGAGEGQDSVPLEPVKVEVLNGSGMAGLAREATHRLRGDGFDVVYFGNAPRFDHERSAVVDRTGDMGAAHRVAGSLGIDSVFSDPDPRLFLDVTVILGRDWPAPEPESNGPMDRLRRWMAPDDPGP
jgi:hypothetical protein